MGCGEFMSGLAMQSGTVYTWGKGEHEKPKFNDYIEYSSPFVILEEKQVVYVAFGRAHCMCVDKHGNMYGWGENTFGCMGFGDTKKRATPFQNSFFTEKRRVVDVACGDGFTVVIAQEFEPIKRKGLLDKLESKLMKQVEDNAKQDLTLMHHLAQMQEKKEKIMDDEWPISLRQPICGSVEVPRALKEKIRSVMMRNYLKRDGSQDHLMHQRLYSKSTFDNYHERSNFELPQIRGAEPNTNLVEIAGDMNLRL